MKNKFLDSRFRGNDKSIYVCGSIAYDRIMDFPGRFAEHILPDKIHILNVSFALNGVRESFGGTGGNIAYSLALLGERPKLASAAGSDFFKYGEWLKKNRVNLDNVRVVKNLPTACAYIMTDKADNQITGFYGGPEVKSPPPPFIKGGKALAIVAPDRVARMAEYVKIFRRLKIPYIFDPGQQITSLSAKELKFSAAGAKVLIGNDYEIQLIADKIKISQDKIKKLAEILIITKGDKGSEIFSRGEKIKIPPARPKAVLDPTGAGDAYRAGFIKGLVMGLDLEKCGRLASVVAAYTVEKYGTQTHKFTLAEVEKRYRENYGKSF